METAPDIQINCFKHPTEKIQRVNPNINSKSHVLCLECLIEDHQEQSSKDLLSISEFLAIAEDFYKNNQQKSATELKAPPEYISAFDEQSKVLTDLTEHLLQEKEKIGRLFDQIKREFIEALEAQRTQYFSELDQQLERLQYWHVFFEKRLRMTYPEATTKFNKAFDSSETPLIKTLEAIKDPKQFEAYIRSIKEDLNEEILQINNKAKPFDQARKLKLPSLYKRLAELQSTRPTYSFVTFKTTRNLEQELIDIKKEVQSRLQHLLDTVLTFDNPIPDVLDDCSCPDSKIIESSSQYPLIREWLPEEHRRQNLQLLYRGSRDGMNSTAFHENCDNKGPTLTLIHCTFYLSSKKAIIGGFLDKNWNSKGEYMKSNKAFLFSLTEKVKCNILPAESQAYAAYGEADFGPTFGFGYELTLNKNFTENYARPQEYANTDLLIDRQNQELVLDFQGQKLYGMNYFEVHEIEVYTFK